MAPKAPKKRKDDGEPELSLECAHAKEGCFVSAPHRGSCCLKCLPWLLLASSRLCTVLHVIVT